MRKKDEPFEFDGDLNVLKGLRIGVVRGYSNTTEFDALMAQKFFIAEEATDDEQNAKKLERGRVKLIVGDPSAIRYSVSTGKGDKASKDAVLKAIEAVSPVLRYNYLYFAFSKSNPDWKALNEQINLAIAEFESSGELFNIIRRTNKACGFQMETLKPFELSERH